MFDCTILSQEFLSRIRMQLLLHLVIQLFTYACDDQLSCSLDTPKMGAVVETWHKRPPIDFWDASIYI